MLIFIMMALGLNIVVGYAGLLDLGYVAFYAMGAYTAAWFASPHFSESIKSFHFGAVGVNESSGGIHVSIWIVLIVAAIFTAFIGVLIGLPTLRLRGDYLAIVTLGFGEIMPQIALNGDNLFNTGFNLTNGPQGINPIDPPGFGTTLENALGLPESYLAPGDNALLAVRQQPRALLLDGARPRPLHGLLLDAAPGLAARPRVDRDPGRRDRGRSDGRPADANEDLGVRGGSVLRRHRRRLLRELQERDVPRGLLLQHLGLHPVHGHPRRHGQHLGRDRRRWLPGVPEPGGPGQHRCLDQRAVLDGSAEWVQVFDEPIDVPLYQFGIFGVILVLVMLFKPEGLIPSARRKAEFEEGVHDEPLYDVTK